MTQKKTLQLRITPELHDKLKAAALKTRPRVSMSELCRFYLESMVELNTQEYQRATCVRVE